MKGWVYILTNPSFNDIKIGYSNDPERRVKELSKSTSAPSDFVIAYKHECSSMIHVEQGAHARLDKCRTNKRKEFFNCSVEEAIKVIKSVDDDLRKKPDEKGSKDFMLATGLIFMGNAGDDARARLEWLGKTAKRCGMTEDQVQEEFDKCRQAGVI